MVEKSVSVRIAAVGGKAVKAEFVEIGREGGKALKGIEAAGGSMRYGLQNVGYQVQDFAVQVAGGTSASRALAQQLPQLLSGFGLLGVGLGTAAAVFVPLIGAMTGGVDTVKQLEGGIKDLNQATSAYQVAAGNVAIPISELTKQFGGQAAAVRELYEAQLAVASINLAKSQQALNAGIESALSSIPKQLAAIDAVRASLARGDVAPEQALISQEAIDIFIDGLGMSEEAARTLQSALDGLAASDGPVAAAAAMSDVRQAIVDAAGGYANLTAAQIELIGKINDAQLAAAMFGATDMSSGLRGANAQAETLVGRINAAIDRGAALQQAYAVATAPGAALRGLDDERGSQHDAVRSVAEYNTSVRLKELFGKPAKAAGGGASGMKSQSDAVREAARVFDQTRTSAEKYTIEQTKLNDLLSSGAIDQDTYNRALKDLKENLNAAGAAGLDMGNQIGGALEDVIFNAKDAKQALGELLASFGKSLFSSGWKALTAALFPSADGNVFSHGSALAFADGGVVGGPTLFPMRRGVGLMGEAGPEAIMPLTRLTGGKLGVRAQGGGGGITINMPLNIDARGAVEGVADQVARKVQEQTPAIVRQAIAGVAAAKRRGYAV